MQEIKEIKAKTTQDGKNRPYFVVTTSEGTCSVFEKKEAYVQIKNKSVEEGDSVKYDTETKTTEKGTFRNIILFTEIRKKGLNGPKPENASMYQIYIIRQNALSHADVDKELQFRTDGKVMPQKEYLEKAKEYEKFVLRRE